MSNENEGRICNARIESVSINNREGRGWTAWVHLVYGGGGQGFGGYSLSGERLSVFVTETCRAVGVDAWEDLVGQAVRVRQRPSQVLAIGNLLTEDWFDPREHF